MSTDIIDPSPAGITVDRAGTIYVADSAGTIRKLTPVGRTWISSTIGGLAGARGSTDGTNSAARFDGAFGIAVDRNGNLFVTDGSNYTVRQGLPVSISPLPPLIQSILARDGLVTFTWSTTPGRSYQVQYSPNLTSTNWINLGNSLTAGDSTVSANDAIRPNKARFYRVIMLP
jgi:hypothetical protein